jgi:hypothetical protein
MSTIDRLVAGDQTSRVLTLSTGDTIATLAAVDLSTAESIEFVATPVTEGDAVEITKTLGDGIEYVTDGSDGQLEIEFDSADLIAGVYEWRITVTWTDEILSWPHSTRPRMNVNAH